MKRSSECREGEGEEEGGGGGESSIGMKKEGREEQKGGNHNQTVELGNFQFMLLIE